MPKINEKYVATKAVDDILEMIRSYSERHWMHEHCTVIRDFVSMMREALRKERAARDGEESRLREALTDIFRDIEQPVKKLAMSGVGKEQDLDELFAAACSIYGKAQAALAESAPCGAEEGNGGRLDGIRQKI